jgi:hypothetical protein
VLDIIKQKQTNAHFVCSVSEARTGEFATNRVPRGAESGDRPLLHCGTSHRVMPDDKGQLSVRPLRALASYTSAAEHTNYNVIVKFLIYVPDYYRSSVKILRDVRVKLINHNSEHRLNY